MFGGSFEKANPKPQTLGLGVRMLMEKWSVGGSLLFP